ncbi:MAG: ArsR family transcriptional regulator, arsenate/arsenite/antimonite-responsive transcriptional [Patescibacteria group bacterium]|nr:ArsR family transcriptional regulator, arsenate/arsenite/antimonite-responsive transcriptional [Patescibacteria group bacterium]
MNPQPRKKMGIRTPRTKKEHGKELTHARPSWVASGEEELCPECFKVVGDRTRYKVVCMLGKEPTGLNVKQLTEKLQLKQPTVTHHLNILRSVNAVASADLGRQRVYTLNRDAHCFEDCKIPYA